VSPKTSKTLALFPAIVKRIDFDAPEVNRFLWDLVHDMQNDPEIRDAGSVRDIATVNAYQPDVVLHEALKSDERWAQFMRAVVHPAIQTYLYEHNRIAGWPGTEYGYTIKASWAVLYSSDSFQAPHHHPDVFCTLAYYPHVPDCPEPQGNIRFINPHIESTYTQTCAWQYHQDIRPQSGTALVFPGWLQHYSFPHRHDEARLLVTFDIKLLPPR